MTRLLPTVFATELSVSGVAATNGIFDATPRSDTSGYLWMSYSTVNVAASNAATHCSTHAYCLFYRWRVDLDGCRYRPEQRFHSGFSSTRTAVGHLTLRSIKSALRPL
jgi:hypothetical protein